MLEYLFLGLLKSRILQIFKFTICALFKNSLLIFLIITLSFKKLIWLLDYWLWVLFLTQKVIQLWRDILSVAWSNRRDIWFWWKLLSCSTCRFLISSLALSAQDRRRESSVDTLLFNFDLRWYNNFSSTLIRWCVPIVIHIIGAWFLRKVKSSANLFKFILMHLFIT